MDKKDEKIAVSEVVESISPWDPSTDEGKRTSLEENSDHLVKGDGIGLGDGLGDGMLGPAPTEEERRILRKVPASIPPMALLIAFLELCERASYYGLTGGYIRHR